jgi:hypothetical protein
MPMDRALVAIPCKLAPGAFSGERVFEVQLADGSKYTSLAPRQFCWNAAGQLVGEREPSASTDGSIAARIVERVEGNQVQVEVPDGEVIAVDEKQIKARPTLITPPSGTPSRP